MGKKALGKGLDALISNSFTEEAIGEGLRKIKIESILQNKYQPRKSFDDKRIEELAASIKENGFIQPIVVRKDGNKYELIVGERRLRAAKIIGLKEVPAFIRDYTEDKILEIAIIENIQREDLNPIEEASAYKMILERDMITQETLAKRIGKSRSYIANMTRVLELPKEIRDNVSRGTISIGQAKAILSLNDKDEQIELANKIKNEKLNVREVEKIARNKNVPRGTIVKRKEPFVEEIEEKLRTKLGTKVSIDYRRGRGSIRIEFYSNDDLDRIIEELS